MGVAGCYCWFGFVNVCFGVYLFQGMAMLGARTDGRCGHWDSRFYLLY